MPFVTIMPQAVPPFFQEKFIYKMVKKANFSEYYDECDSPAQFAERSKHEILPCRCLNVFSHP